MRSACCCTCCSAASIPPAPPSRSPVDAGPRHRRGGAAPDVGRGGRPDRDRRRRSPVMPRGAARPPAGCSGTLRGDLDTIVAKALKKTASERYASVTALADDLRRFSASRADQRAADTLRYRAARFVRRHAAGSRRRRRLSWCCSAALTVFYTTRLATERDRAQREAAKAAKVSEALTGLLTGADPIANRATPDGLTVRGLLDAARRAGAEGARGPARGAGRDPDGHRTDLPPARHVRQGAAAARTGARQRPGGVRAGARQRGADPQRSRRAGGGEGRLRRRRPRASSRR